MRGMARYHFDLLSAVGLALLLTVQVAFLPDFQGASRIVVGLIVGLVVPGYTFMAALFPRKDDIDVAERVALSLGLSVVTITLVGLAMNFMPWGIRLVPMSIGLVVWSLLFSGVAVVRRSQMLPSKQFSLQGVITPRQLFLGVAFAALIVFFLPFLGPSRSFTEFYLLGEQGGFDLFPPCARAWRDLLRRDRHRQQGGARDDLPRIDTPPMTGCPPSAHRPSRRGRSGRARCP